MDKHASDAAPLDAIRQEIDSIDEQIVDLLCARFAATARVREAKAAAPQPGIPYRPGREAIIVRRLQTRAGGGLPAGLVDRVWRTIISSSTALQADVRLVVASDTMSDSRFGEAISLFAGMMPVDKVRSLKASIEALSPDQPVLAVVPMKSGWYAQVAKLDELRRPRVVTVLPAGSDKPSRALAVLGFAISEPTGEDETLVVTTGKLPRDFVPKPVWSMKVEGDLHLTAVPGYLSMSEQPLVGLKGNSGLELKVAGRYPSAMEMTEE
jgi:chorismate mutase / prephenate dehydratase